MICRVCKPNSIFQSQGNFPCYGFHPKKTLLFISVIASFSGAYVSPAVAGEPGVRIFANKVESFAAGGGASAPHNIPENALGAPNYKIGQNFVALGDGGKLVVSFSGVGINQSVDNGADLLIHEVGDLVEAVSVSVSNDGVSWTDVGSTTSVVGDIDTDSVSPPNTFKYVRLIDKAPNESKTPTAGADIDAIEVVDRRNNEQKGSPGKSCAANGVSAASSVNNTSSAAPVSAVNAVLGNNYQHEGDYSAPGVSHLGFSRSYNSLDGVWRHNYSTRLNIKGNSIALVKSDGREIYFKLVSGVPVAKAAELGKLVKVGTTWNYTSADNEKLAFNSNGRLTSIVSADNLKQTITYPTGKVTVTDDFGQTLSFTEDYQNQPLTLSTSGLTVAYTYTLAVGLTKITKTAGAEVTTRVYHYEDLNNPSLLTGITDERGVRYATWTYSAEGRAISSAQAGNANSVQVAYNSDGSTTVTNELGKQTIYRFVTIAGIKYVSAIEGEPSANCPASNSTFTYNDRGQVLTQTDAKGFITTYAYNDRGLETSRIEATGTAQARTTTTTWHGTFNLPLTVTEGGQMTTYTYDALGRQTSRVQVGL